MIFAASVLVALALSAVVVWVGRRTDAVVQSAAIGLAADAVVWAAALLLIRTGWKDIDGFIDCHGYCHGWHYVGALLFGTPPLVAALLGLVLLVSGLRAVLHR